MNSGKSIYAQLMEFIPIYEFRKCVKRYNGNYKIRNFTCWEQFLCMSFAQLTYRESLRDVEACLRAVHKKLYHIGIRSRVSRNTLANANQVRDWRIYADFILQILSVTLLGKIQLLQAFSSMDDIEVNGDSCNQLNLFN